MTTAATPHPQGMFPAEIRNLDLVYLADKVARYAFEVLYSASSDMAFTSAFDIERMAAYLGDMKAAIAHFNEAPLMDRVESHPMSHPIKPFPEIRDMESDELDHVVRMLQATYVEIINSQSARIGNGLAPFDTRRLLALVTKVEKWLTDYVKTRQPMDLPESTPMQAPVLAGNLGV